MTTLQDFISEGWTTEELREFSIDELRGIAHHEARVDVPANATKADLVAFLSGQIAEIPPQPEDMIRTAIQYRSWVRGVPPAHACLTAADKYYLNNLWHALDPIWYFTS